MMNLALIGKGKWGSILEKNLKKKYIVKTFSSRDNLKTKNFEKFEFIIIATPNKTHYQLVKFFLKKNKNVFCEKPLCLKYNKAKELISLSKKNKVKLFINDIEIYKKKKLRLNKSNFIVRGKKKSYSTKEVLYAWMYHDIYLLERWISKKNFKSFLIQNTPLQKKILIKSLKRNFIFTYNLDKNIPHKINQIKFSTKKNFIPKMFSEIFSDKASMSANQKRALKCIQILDIIQNKIQ